MTRISGSLSAGVVHVSSLYERVMDPDPLDMTKIAPNLWLGAHPPTGRHVSLHGFDVLVLCAEEYQPPASNFDDVAVVHAPFDDNRKTGMLPEEKIIAEQAAVKVAEALQDGKEVLVTCWMGRNRSALVASLALLKLGKKAEQIIKTIHDRREKSLTNQWFLELIRMS